MLRLTRRWLGGDKKLSYAVCSKHHRHWRKTSFTVILWQLRTAAVTNRPKLTTCRFVTEHASVLIAGPTGMGKSHLVQALGHCALRVGHDVLFITHTKLLAQLHAARTTNSYDRKLAQLAKIEVIAIDDFGLRPMRTPQDEDFHELIAERYERKTTLVTSNQDFEEWGAAFPNKLMGAATLDRLLDGAYRIILGGETRRKPRPMPAKEKTTTGPDLNTGYPQPPARQR